MLRKGQVSSVDILRRTARVTFIDMDSIVTAEIPLASHIAVEVNDRVTVALFSNNLSDGLVIAVF